MIVRSQSDNATAVTADALPYEPDHYGLVYLYPHSDWGPDKRAEMDAALANARSWGVTTILQTFSTSLVNTPQAENWLIFLDAAEAAGIDIVAYLWPRTTYPVIDGPFYYDDLKSFLDVVGDHPALIGYVGLHEPLEPQMGISAEELRGFYTEMKSYAPDLLLAHFMGNMAYVEEHRTDGWMFSDGMCDICLIWYYPFETIGGEDVYQEEMVTAVIQDNLTLTAERDIDAQLWFLGQSFAAPGEYPRQLRMPTAAEMEAVYLRAMENPLDGFLWYPWSHTEVYDQVLCDPGNEEQQAMVDEIGTTYAHLKRIYFPVVKNDN
ncbi:MAG: hypothetical protein H6667_19995 [Ardenticatenaceae bacterium]|nr:hypothetical protein [Ardenticatenaceae bacterium]MCB9443931.1 hypothetical protein [Ardenticatenaceae bacterium]